MKGRNVIISLYSYRVYPESGNSVCAIRRIPCAFTACVDQLDKEWLSTIPPSVQPRYGHVEKFYY